MIRPRIRASIGTAALIVGCLCVTSLRADNDAVEGAWGTVHADIFGTAATTEIPYTLGQGPIEEKWRLDIVGEGHDRAGGRVSITFDKAGNLYWISSTGGGTGGQVRLVSADPAGSIRWAGNDGLGNVHVLGTIFSGASAVVGEARVYGLGDVGGLLSVAAYDKETGLNLWTTDLDPSTVASGVMLTPVLYAGKLYVVGLSEGKSRDVYRLDAESGDMEWASTIPEVGITVGHQAAFVPDAFDTGVHGLYFNGDSGNGTDGIGEVYGIRIGDSGASLGWSNDAGKAARSHMIYSDTTSLLYTCTWTDYGADFYVFDPVTGLVNAYNNAINTGHGFYDVACLDFDGSSIVAGGFDGNILRYEDTGGGTMVDSLILKGGTAFAAPFWGETRVLGQLLQDTEGNSILIAGTNSLQCCASHVVAIDVTRGTIVWEYDTGIRNPHQFNYAGGPIVGPDGKIYYFERPADGSTALIALGPAATRTVKPSAGFLLVDSAGANLDPVSVCVKSGETVQADGSCSVGTDIVYTYTAEPAEGVIITQASPSDSAAELRFPGAGNYVVSLRTENGAGFSECSRELCVLNTMPACSLLVTDAAGDPIDSADDDDGIPCLPVDADAKVDASGSSGGDLVYEFTVTPSTGTSVEHEDPSSPLATITFTEPGTYRIGGKVTNDQGSANCGLKVICVTELVSLPKFLRGNCNADGNLDLSDAIFHLSYLFLGGAPPPCEEACNTNGDGTGDLSDAVYLLTHLFLGGPAPEAPYPTCDVDPVEGPLPCLTPHC